MRNTDWRKRFQERVGVASDGLRTPSRKRRPDFIPEIEPLEARLTPAAPTIVSINRTTPSVQFTNAASVAYAVTFDQPVTGVDASDFKVVKDSTLQVAAPLVVGGGGAVYSVTVNGIAGDGRLQIGLLDDDTILGQANQLPLNGPGFSTGFEDQITYPAGSQLTGAILTDINSDGRADLVGATPTALSVLLGNGDGTFQPLLSVATSVTARVIAPAGFNGDGKVDLVTINSDQSMTIFLGNGNGTFQPAFATPNPTASMPMTITDLNRDGFADIVFKERYAVDNLRVMLGNGNGTFRPSALITSQVSPMTGPDGSHVGFVRGADVNGDHKPDLVYSSSSSTFGVLLGNGDGTFRPRVTYSGIGATDGTLADMNHDGVLDVVTVGSLNIAANGRAVVFLGNGDGTFGSGKLLEAHPSPFRAIVADVNGDTHQDIVTSDRNNVAFGILFGNGDGSFRQAVSYAAPIRINQLAAADINADGLIDFAVSMPSTGTFGVHLNNRVALLSQDYRIDQTGPSTSLTATPPPLSNSKSAAIGFVGQDPSVGGVAAGIDHFEYRIDGGAFTIAMAGASLLTLDGLSEGDHTVGIRSVDEAGNVGAAATFTWKVDLSTPATTITSPPEPNTKNTTAVFSFTSSVPPVGGLARQEYSIDGGPFVTAVSPLTISGLAEGLHNFLVRGVGGAGSVGPAASYSWTIDLTGPNVSLVATPPVVTTLQTASFSVNAIDPTSSGVSSGVGAIEYQLDDAPFSQGPLPASYYSLPFGHHTFRVRATDSLGNVGGATTYTWLVTPVVAPTVSSIQSVFPSAPVANEMSAVFAVTFSKPVAGVDAGDFGVVVNGTLQHATPILVSGSGADYTVTINGVSGDGSLGLKFVDNGSIRDVDGSVVASPVPAFANLTTYGVGGDPRALTSADLNNDGRLDLIAGKWNNMNLGVLIGNGDGTFRPALSVPLASRRTLSVAAADFNSDGKMDLVASNTDGGEFSILFGDGDGKFRPIASIAGYFSNHVTTGDVNSDGKADIVYITSTSGSTVGVYLGNGDGTFRPQTIYDTDRFANDTTLVDVNADGILDIVVANQSRFGGALLGNGDGTFRPMRTFATGVIGISNAVADFNSDGIPDVVTGDPFVGYTAPIALNLGNGDGTFRPPTFIEDTGRVGDIVATDINGDGSIDIVASLSLGAAAVYMGNGDGSFRPRQTFATGSDPGALVFADLNGDGHRDIATANVSTGSVTVLLSKPVDFTTPLILFDHTYPTVSLSAQPAPVTSVGAATFVFTGNDPIVGGSSSGLNRIEYQLDSGSRFTATSPLTFTGLGEGTHTLQLRAVDNAGNVSAVVSTAWLVKSGPPNVQSIKRAVPAAEATNATSVTFTATFSAPVSGVDASDFALARAGVTTYPTMVITPVTGSVYNIAVSGVVGNGTLGVNFVDDGSVRDLAGNVLTGGGATGQTYVIDQTTPTLTITPDAATLTTTPTTFTFAFSEPVTGFAASSIALTTGTAGAFTAVDASTYTLVVTPMANGPATVSVASGNVFDAAGNGIAAASVSVTYAIPTAPTTTTLAANPNATTGGTLVTFTATITPSPGNLGTVAFKVNGATLAGAGSVPVVGAVATFTTAALVAGTHPITADYSGTLGFANSSSNPLSITVTSATTTTTLTAATPNLALPTQPVSITVTVAGGAATSGETITLADASNGNAPVAAAGGVLANGSTTLTIAAGTLSAGTHNLVARYAGNGFNAPSQSAPVPLVIAAAPQVVSIIPNGNLPGFAGLQRSRVVSAQVIFDRAVQLDAGALALAVHTQNVVFGGVPQPAGFGGLPASLQIATSDNIAWTITFAGNTDDGADGLSSLKDGVYDLKIDAAKVHPFGVSGLNMAADRSTTFHRLFGDTGVPATPAGGVPGIDFEAVVNTGDNLAFRGAFNNPAGYKVYLDLNGDGVINSGDNLQFRNRFNKSLAWKV